MPLGPENIPSSYLLEEKNVFSTQKKMMLMFQPGIFFFSVQIVPQVHVIGLLFCAFTYGEISTHKVGSCPNRWFSFGDK